MSRVRAIEAGYDNNVVRQPGEKFEWPDTIEVKGEEVKNPIPDWCEKLPDATQGQGKKGKQGENDTSGANLA